MITSTSNQRVKEIVQLQKKSKARNTEGVFIVEGIRMVREIPEDKLKALYVTEEFYKKHKAELPGNVKPEFVTPTVFSYISDTKTPQGVLAIVWQNKYALPDILDCKKEKRDLLLVLDNLQDPGNLGTILRTAEGAGVTGILMDRECVDIYNPKTIRSTMGSVYRMSFVYVEDLENAIRDLKDKGITTYAAHLEGTHSYDEEDLKKPCAFLIGNEGNGLRREIADMADCYIKIPMLGQVESLNAAIASSVLMFEAARQRRK